MTDRGTVIRCSEFKGNTGLSEAMGGFAGRILHENMNKASSKVE